MMSGSVFALSAGFLGAGASLSAKLSLGSDHLRDMCVSGLSSWAHTHGRTAVCDWVPIEEADWEERLQLPLTVLHIPLRLLCAVLLFTCNTIMWTFFSKALRHCSSSARATVTTTASNFIFSAIMGKLIFGETHTALWWAGISLTLCGLVVLHGSSPQPPPLEEGKKDT